MKDMSISELKMKADIEMCLIIIDLFDLPYDLFETPKGAKIQSQGD